MRNWIAMFLAVVAVIALIRFAQGPSHPPWIPQEPPREEWRVVHPNGFSIVCPPGWSVNIVTNPPDFSTYKYDAVRLRSIDSITLRGGGKRVRFAPFIRVTDRWEDAPNLSRGYHETDFLNMKAYERTELFSGNTRLTYELLFTNQGRWYQILYDKPIDSRDPSATNMPALLLRYFQSFRPIP